MPTSSTASRETREMGRGLVSATIENVNDVYNAARGLIRPDEVRRVDADDALVDTGASGLFLPRRLVAALGLLRVGQRSARALGGPMPMQMYSAVQLTIQGRSCVVDVGEIDDSFPVLVGQIPLEAMDWVVDMAGRKLIGNPDHGGLHMVDVL